MTDLQKELSLAKDLARQAGQKIMQIYGTEFAVEHKGENDPLTEADLASNEIIIAGLSESFSTDAILSEEKEDDESRLNAQRIWVIDPLDGTKEFVKRNGEFTVNIGLVENGEPILGVIYAPVLDTLYYAAKGSGSHKEQEGSTQALKVSTHSVLKDFVLVKSRSHPNEHLEQFINDHKITKLQVIGSSLKGCLVASGDADVYPRFNPMWEWDVCAMHAIVTEAGGKVTDLFGKSLIYNKELPKHTDGFMISNNTIHEELING